jgi:hypothetical protein
MSNFRTHISQKQFIPVLLKYENKTKLDAFHPFIQDDLGYFSVHPPASSPSCLITDHKSLDSRKREKPNPPGGRQIKTALRLISTIKLPKQQS